MGLFFVSKLGNAFHQITYERASRYAKPRRWFDVSVSKGLVCDFQIGQTTPKKGPTFGRKAFGDLAAIESEPFKVFQREELMPKK